MVDLIPVDHDPYNDPPSNLIPVDHDPWANVPRDQATGRPVVTINRPQAEGVVAKPGQTVQTPQGPDVNQAASTVGDMLGMTDAMRAIRGELTPEEAQTFAMGAATMMLGGPEAKAGEEAATMAARSLPMDEASRMARAVKQGFTIDAYHGTGSAEFQAFDPSKVQDNIQYGGNFYFTTDPEFANKHTGKWSGDTPRVMPVKLKVENPFRMDQPVTAEQAADVLKAAGRDDQAQAMLEGGPLKHWSGSTLFYFGLGQDTPAAVKAQAIRDAGYDGIIGDPNQEIAGTPGRPHIMVFEPSQVRSRFDSFDPANIGSNKLIHDVPSVQELKQAGIRAYHGSPYDFNQFDLSKIGTGEGAQAYGHGLYFAENPKVAEEYKNQLSTFTANGKPLSDDLNIALGAYNGDVNALLDFRRSQLDKWQSSGVQDTKNIIPQLQQDIRQLTALQKQKVAPTGKTYEVNINADPEHFLDLDANLNQQSSHVKDALRRAGIYQEGPYRSGALMYQDLTDRGSLNAGYEGRQAAASAALREAGIPGIKYLDQGSRNVPKWVAHHPQGGINDFPNEQQAKAFVAKNPEYSLEAPKQTKNYVVFNDKLIDIVKKYGLAGLVAGGAAHFTTQPVDHDPFQ